MRLIPRLRSRTITTSNRRRPAARLRLEHLEDRAVPSFGFGSAFNVGSAGGDNQGFGVALDASRNLYVAGLYTGTVDFDPNHASQNSVLTATGSDSFVAKYAPDGTFAWATDLGAGVQARVAVGGSAVYASINSLGGVARLDPGTGAVLWNKTVISGGSTKGLAVDPSGNVDVTGRTSSSSASQVFVTQLDSAGNTRWTATTSGGGTGNVGVGLAVDGAGNVYATGQYQGTVTYGTTRLTSLTSTAHDAFVWKLNSSGASVWAGSVGSTGDDSGFGIAVDGGGNVALTGMFSSSSNNFNPGSGKAVTLPFSGIDDIYIAKLAQGKNGAMTLSWAKGIGGSGVASGQAVAIDAAGNVYTTGSFAGTVNFNPNPGTAHYLSGGGGFVSKLDASGNYVAAGALASSANNGIGRAIAVDGSGNVYTTGEFSGTADFDPTSGTYNLTANGSWDVFVSVLTQTLTPGAVPPGGPNPVVPPSSAGTGAVTLSPTAPTIALPATADSVAPEQIDWLLAAAARKRSSLFAEWLAASDNA